MPPKSSAPKINPKAEKFPTFTEIRRTGIFRSRRYDAGMKRCFKRLLKAAWWKNRLEAIRELGYALVYMDFLHGKDMHGKKWSWEPQRSTVVKLCRELAYKHGKTSPRFWARFRQKVELEIENMC